MAVLPAVGAIAVELILTRVLLATLAFALCPYVKGKGALDVERGQANKATQNACCCCSCCCNARRADSDAFVRAIARRADAARLELLEAIENCGVRVEVFVVTDAPDSTLLRDDFHILEPGRIRDDLAKL